MDWDGTMSMVLVSKDAVKMDGSKSVARVFKAGQAFNLSRSKSAIDWKKNIAAMTGWQIRSMNIIFSNKRGCSGNMYELV